MMKMMEVDTKAEPRRNCVEVIPMRFVEHKGIRRFNEPVRFGIPCPKGVLRHEREVTLWDETGKERPFQCQRLALWTDGSLKWLQVECFVSVDAWGTCEYHLKINSGSPSVHSESTVTAVRVGDRMYVKTGRAEFHLSTRSLKPFDAVVIADRVIAGGEESRVSLQDASGEELLSVIDDMTVEDSGPLRLTVRAGGRFVRAGSTFANVLMRWSFYAGQSFAEIDLTLGNSRAASHPGGLWDLGDEGSIIFRDCAIHMAPVGTSFSDVAWTDGSDSTLTNARLGSFELYQDSSGGPAWNSSNHVNRHGKVTTTFQGYRVKMDGQVVGEGLRAIPILSCGSDRGRVSATMEHFWQNFPKALEATQIDVTLRLFPHQQGDAFELQGGEQKTHRILVHCSDKQEPPSLAWFHHRLRPMISRSWYAGSRAIAYLDDRPPDVTEQGAAGEAERLVQMAVTGDNTFFDRRERIDEYGWRNFGDVYADHESVGAKEGRPIVAHYNNQYDVVYGAVVQYLRSGNERWYELCLDLARHVCDIDIYRTGEDRPAFNGGLFWHTDHYTDAGTATHRTYSRHSPQAKQSSSYGGGPACEHNYTSGLLHCYYLTGDPAFKEAVLLLVGWVVHMDDGRSRRLGALDGRPTGYCSVTATQGYHGPGRGAGNSISVLLDGLLLTGEVHYLAKAEELIRRCIHPHDDIAARDLTDIEYRWSYTVFLQVLGKYLDVKIERGELDFMYAYARASLLHYAAWMASNEVPYKQVLHRVLIATETWPAQDIRKAGVFCLAVKHADDNERQAYVIKAEEFFHACLRDLLSFKTHALVRPIVLLMTNAYAVQYGLAHLGERAPQPATDHVFGSPKTFKPQFHELYCLRTMLSSVMNHSRAILQRVGSLARPGEVKRG
jgi:hypothetical protein